MSSDGRPDPDDLLKRVNAEQASAKRGKLTIFFGAAPGVGKTYAMLEAARAEKILERDVVAGVVETHGRYDTSALLLGLELLPRRKILHRQVLLQEFDIDAALARKPGVLLVDELAHTNAPGSRHTKRWQDVEEILDAGIDVFATLNVQHIESLNDVVAQITGVVVRETLPDAVLAQANEVRLIDLPPQELLERLQEGKVYLREQAARATDNFFRKGNLIALRELALRQTAARVDADMDSYRRLHGIERTWAVGERILVCVSPSPASARLVRATRRMASLASAGWIAAYMETPESIRLSRVARERVSGHLRLAERLGAEVVTLSGERPSESILQYARSRNVTRIVLGKPTHPRWRDLFRPSFLEEMVRASGQIDIHVISGEETVSSEPAGPERKTGSSSTTTGPHLFAGFAAIAIATLFSWFVFGQAQLADVVMIYLLGIVLVAARFGYAPSLLAAVLSVIAYDFFFVPPYFSFAVSDLRHITTFAVMFVVAIVISGLTKRIREQAESARGRELRTAALYAMSRELADTRSSDLLARVTARHLHDVFDCKIALLRPAESGALTAEAGGDLSFNPAEKEVGVAEWVWRHSRSAGLGTDTLPSASALYIPLVASRGCLGVLGVLPADAHTFADPDKRQLLETFAGQLGTALERAELAVAAQRAELQVETEQLRNALLSSVSHDLRTPLAVITGAASALSDVGMPAASARELLDTISSEAGRLNRLVRNLLDMTRLEAGALRVKKEWQPLEEIVGAVLNRLDDQLQARPVSVKLDPALVPLDEVTVDQVLTNLLENALKYTPSGSPIEITARKVEGGVEVEIADRGPGIPAGEEERIFEKFHRAAAGKGGVGLGLTICRGIVAAHGGRLYVENRIGGGAAFRFTLPIVGEAPRVEGPEEGSSP
jgi:two-component system sensor histidine kinase KdpD